MQVAVGVILNNNSEVLITKRSLKQHQGGLWEFPGGKVADNETASGALARELQEEVAINATEFEPLMQLTHHYPDKSVELHVFLVTDFSGKPQANEGQPMQWLPIARLTEYEFPAANEPIIRAVQAYYTTAETL